MGNAAGEERDGKDEDAGRVREEESAEVFVDDQQTANLRNGKKWRGMERNGGGIQSQPE